MGIEEYDKSPLGKTRRIKMTKDKFLKLDHGDLNDDGADILVGYQNDLCSISDSDDENTINVFWYSASNSIAPGGPKKEVGVTG
jgi:hypothetical protein